MSIGWWDDDLLCRTGALRLGDRILAVNNESIDGMKAADVMNILQQSTDLVTIKVMRIIDRSAAQSTGLSFLQYF